MGFSGRKLVYIFFILNLLFVTKISRADSYKSEFVVFVTSAQNQSCLRILEIANLIGLDEVNSLDPEPGIKKSFHFDVAAHAISSIKNYRNYNWSQPFYLPLIFDLPPP